MFSIFDDYKNLVVALSEREDGPMKLSGNDLKDKAIIKNRKRFLNKLGIDIDSVVSAGLGHTNTVKIVTTQNRGELILKTDGLATNEKNLFLSVTVADCLPIFLYDPEKEVVALIHGGWRNLAQNILASAAREFINNFGSRPETILAGIGPGISQCHFEVKEDVSVKFQQFLPETLKIKNGKMFLDLKKIVKLQLLNLGLKEKNIEINPECTFCLIDKYFSYRRDHPTFPETMLAVIGRK